MAQVGYSHKSPRNTFLQELGPASKNNNLVSVSGWGWSLRCFFFQKWWVFPPNHPILIGLSFIFTIHFGGLPPISRKLPRFIRILPAPKKPRPSPNGNSPWRWRVQQLGLVLCTETNPKWPLFWLEFRPCFGGLTFKNVFWSFGR